MPSLLLACALALASLVACSGAAPATATAPTTAATTESEAAPLCDAACWRQLNNFLAETCRCASEACAEQTREKMIAWVTVEVVEAKRLTDRQQEVELPLELEPYDSVDEACTARLRPAPSPTRRRAFVDGRVAVGPRFARAVRAAVR